MLHFFSILKPLIDIAKLLIEFVGKAFTSIRHWNGAKQMWALDAEFQASGKSAIKPVPDSKLDRLCRALVKEGRLQPHYQMGGYTRPRQGGGLYD